MSRVFVAYDVRGKRLAQRTTRERIMDAAHAMGVISPIILVEDVQASCEYQFLHYACDPGLLMQEIIADPEIKVIPYKIMYRQDSIIIHILFHGELLASDREALEKIVRRHHSPSAKDPWRRMSYIFRPNLNLI